MPPTGARRWPVAEGYMPEREPAEPAMPSHEAPCLVNTGDGDACVRITLYVGDPEPVPRDTGHESVLESDRRIADH